MSGPLLSEAISDGVLVRTKKTYLESDDRGAVRGRLWTVDRIWSSTFGFSQGDHLQGHCRILGPTIDTLAPSLAVARRPRWSGHRVVREGDNRCIGVVGPMPRR